MTQKKTDASPIEKAQDMLSETTEEPLCSIMEDAFQEILKAGTNHGIFVSINYALKQYRLEGKYDAAFIINECFFRAQKAQANGKVFHHPQAWIRLTAKNVVKELSRSEKKKWQHPEIDDDSLAPKLETTCPQDILDDAQQKRLLERQTMKKAFQALPPLEQLILQLKVVEHRKWEDIQQILIQAGYALISKNALSQRKRRALARLKANFHNITTA